MRKIVSAILFLSLSFIAVPPRLLAQVLYGSLVGTVTDSSDLAVPGATVKITQVETNQSRETVSNDTGGYSFTNVAAGTYSVEVALPGFQPFRSNDIVVRVNNAVRVDAKLNVGTLSETVVVTGQAALLQTETAVVQTQTTSEQLQNLPINGRSFQSLLTLTPGVAQPNYFQTGGINNPARSMQVSVNGAPNSNTVFRLDGVSATNQWIQGLQAYTPGIEAIETVNVVTNSFDAEQGMAGGASVNVQIKSGTNNLKGSAFELFQSDKMRSRNYFLPVGQPKTHESKHIYGGTVGGPIRQDKLFYFLSVESTHNNTVGGPYVTQNSGSATQFLNLPPAALRAGNFAGSGTIIYDPSTGAANGTGRVPFAFQNCGISSTTDPRFDACNFIPASRINQIAKNILAFLPQPTLPGNVNNYFSNPAFTTIYTKIDSKLTLNVNPSLNINGRVSVLPATDDAAGLYPIVGNLERNPLALGTTLDSNVSSASLSATKVVSQNFVIDGLFGFTRQHTFQLPGGPEKCWGAEVGIVNACQPPLQRDYAMPRIDISNWSSYGNGIRTNDNTGSVFDYLDPQWQYVVNAGWNKGTHNVKFGADVHRLHMNHYEITAPSFQFTGGVTALSGSTAPNLYNAFADFLLGLPQSRNTALQNLLLNEDSASNEQSATLRSWEYGIYIRDQFQLTRKITVSAGVRWEYYPVPQHADRGVEVFDFSLNRLKLCGLGSVPIDCGISVQKDLFTPRVGVAYRANDSLVFRAGFSRNPQNDNMIGNRMRNFPVNVQINESGATTLTPVGSFSEGYPKLPILDLTQPIIEAPAGVAITTNEIGPYTRGVITTFNATVQKMLPHAFSVQVGYVGNRQRDIARSQNINYSQIGGGNASLPFNQPGLVGNFRTTAGVSVVKPLGKVNYDSMQASVTRRLTSGLAVTGAYTYAHGIDWWAGGILIPEYFGLNKGTQGGNTPHKLDVSTMYELPFGEGKKFLSQGGVAAAIAGGWQVNAYLTAISGTPFTVTAATASLNANSPQRADQVKDSVEILGDIGVDKAWFDPTAFKPVTEARFGTADFNSMRGPSYANLDMSFFRTVRLGRTKALQGRIEVFNITNTAHFANPGNNIGSVVYNADGTIRALNGFAAITGTNSLGREYDERYIRIGVRLSF